MITCFGLHRFRRHVLAALLLLLAPVLFAQVSGFLTGSVADPSGLPVLHAHAKLISETTGAAREAQSDSTGVFTFNAVQPGFYTLLVEADGFRRYERKNIELTASERFSLGQIGLTLGTLADSITVSEQGAEVQTASSERSGMLSSSEFRNLTVINRDFAALISLMPGVVETTSSETAGMSGSTAWNVQGQRNTANSVTVDGQGTENMLGYARNTFVSQDAISTVKVLVSNFQAEFGRKPGATVQAVTKSGTQQFHGTAYWYKRHEMFNANNFFNNRQNISEPLYRYTTAGFSIGGPVIVPGVFNKDRNKLFFFFSNEILREWRPAGIQQVNMPTELERAGNFSNSRDVNGALFIIRDPQTLQAFPNNTIPASRLNKNTQNLLNAMPLPNFANTAISGYRYNYQYQESLSYPKNSQTLRADYNINPSTPVYFRYFRWDENVTGSNVPAAAGAWGWLQSTFRNHTDSYLISLTRILDPTLVLEASSSVLVYHEGSSPTTQEALEKVTRTKAGVNIPQFYPEMNPLNLIPAASFGGITGGPSISYDQRYPYRGAETVFTENVLLTKTHGAHTMKAGLWANRWRIYKGEYANFTGSFNFGRDTNNPFDSNHPYSNALLGNFTSYSESNARPAYDQRATVLEWFVQDNWRINSRLTLDLGLRFSWSQPWHAPYQEEAQFMPGRWDPAKVVTLLRPEMVNGARMAVDPLTGTVYPAAMIGFIAPNSGDPFNGSVTTKQDPSLPPGLRGNSGIKPAPRIGFAYDVFGNHRTAIRAGLGIFYDTEDSNTSNNAIFRNPPIRADQTIYYGSLDTFMQKSGLLSTVGTMGYETRRPLTTSYQINFGIQQDVGFGTVVDASYVGTLSRQLIQAVNLNSIPYGANFLAKNVDPTTKKVMPAVFLRPLVGYTDVNYWFYGGNGSYHSLQVTANRRFARGLQFGAAWTWSKAMDYGDGDGSALSTFVDPKVWNYGLAGYDRTHIFKLSYTWDVPRLSRVWNQAVVRGFFDGWQLSGITSFVSGSPLSASASLTTTTDISGSPTEGSRINVIGNPVLPKSERTFSHFFNAAAFAAPVVGTPGNAPKYMMRGPGINNWDMSVFKEIRLPWEQVRLQFRGEAYNAFNHTQFAGVNSSARFDGTGKQTNIAFGEMSSARAARRIQLALRLSF